MANQPSRTPTFVALGLLLVALVISAIGGFSNGSLLGALVAVAAVIPAALGMWHGIQEKTQSGLGLAIGVFFLALAVSAVLVVLKVIAAF